MANNYYELRPTGDTSYNFWDVYNATGAHYKAMETGWNYNDDTTYVVTSGYSLDERYYFSHLTLTGFTHFSGEGIDTVTVYVNAKHLGPSGTTQLLTHLLVDSGGTVDTLNGGPFYDDWNEDFCDYGTVQPWNGLPWTVTAVNNMTAGFRSKNFTKPMKVTNVYFSIKTTSY